MCGTAGIANGTAHSIGHLIAASFCQGRLGPVFLLRGYTNTSLVV